MACQKSFSWQKRILKLKLRTHHWTHHWKKKTWITACPWDKHFSQILLTLSESKLNLLLFLFSWQSTFFCPCPLGKWVWNLTCTYKFCCPGWLDNTFFEPCHSVLINNVLCLILLYHTALSKLDIAVLVNMYTDFKIKNSKCANSICSDEFF